MKTKASRAAWVALVGLALAAAPAPAAAGVAPAADRLPLLNP